MNKKRVLTLVMVLALLVTTVSIAAAVHNRDFGASLSGGEEVPPVATNARGRAAFQVNDAATAFRFRLTVFNIMDVTQAHIHCGPAGMNGSVVVFLYPDGPPSQLIPGLFSGVLAQGVRTNADIIPVPDSAACPGGVANMADLVDKINSGGAYVNVHTLANPGGEIRGQIR